MLKGSNQPETEAAIFIFMQIVLSLAMVLCLIPFIKMWNRNRLIIKNKHRLIDELLMQKDLTELADMRYNQPRYRVIRKRIDKVIIKKTFNR